MTPADRASLGRSLVVGPLAVLGVFAGIQLMILVTLMPLGYIYKWTGSWALTLGVLFAEIALIAPLTRGLRVLRRRWADRRAEGAATES